MLAIYAILFLWCVKSVHRVVIVLSTIPPSPPALHKILFSICEGISISFETVPKATFLVAVAVDGASFCCCCWF